MIDLTKSDMNQFQYSDWISYFKNNDTQRLKIDFSEEKMLPENVKHLIYPSMRIFQKGEGSDGTFLMHTVERYIKMGGPIDYQQAMQLFIKEENWHSAYLKTYMNYYKIPAARKSVLDTIFRKIRHLGGLKCEVTILVTSEMIALTYYDALSKCTDSKVLKQICQQMLNDELPHIIFQSYTLSRLNPSGWDIFVRKLIMNVTLPLVWGVCHKVYRTGGYHFSSFMKEANGYLRQSVYLSQKQKAKSYKNRSPLKTTKRIIDNNKFHK